MAVGTQSKPMRWAAGPLDIARRQKEKDFTPAIADVLRKWLDLSLLAPLRGAPVNCLVVSWASGLPADAEQQQALKPLLDAGRQAGLDFVGLIEGPADKTAAIAAARSAGLSAVAMETLPPANAGIPVIAWAKSGQALWGAPSPVLGMSDGLWPGVPQEKTPTGGPTNLPWVDSNGALLAMTHALAPDKTVWVVVDPPRQAKLTAENYILTVADTEAYGGHWVISLDDQMRAGLAANSAQAMADWKKITDALTFFEQDKASGAYERMGRLAILSNFSPPDREFGEDALNMLPRLREPFRVIARTQAMAASFDGLEGILYVDQEPPDAKLRQKLTAFANAGGTLFVPSKWPNPEGSPIQLSSAEAYLLFSLRRLGKGRLAVAREDKPDSYFTCMDVQNILSHRGDPARLYNGASMNYFFQTSAQGRQGVIHVLNYSRRPGSDNALIYLKTPWRSARYVSMEIPSPVALQWAAQNSPYEIGGAAELSLPRISVYGAVQMET
ncbi:MAG: hypothetical protein ABSA47_13570 [Verrucomicrobiota bacterium]|jgi:hypothetical protein